MGKAYEDQRQKPAQGHGDRGHQGATTSHVKIDIGGGQMVTASITNAAVEELDLKKGQKAVAIIKASDVMIGVE